MLSHAIPSQQLARSLLRKAIVCEVVSRQLSSSAWASSQPKQQQQEQQQQRPARLRRPIINGKTVPFHISELNQHNTAQVATTSNTSTSSTSSSSTILNDLLSVQKKTFKSDLVVVLDMDECLIHSKFLNPDTAHTFAHQLMSQRRNASTALQKTVDSFRFSLPDGDVVHVNIRPGLTDFLNKVCSNFETHIFTAAMPIYANPLLDVLDPNNTLFAGRWFRDSCHYDATKNAYVKKLENIVSPNQLDRVVLVDNNPASFHANPSNGILVDSFYNDADDTQLDNVWRLLQDLEDTPDVRPVLGRTFGLEQALAQPELAPLGF
jgi:Dullard-like phosphatase family protein